jgi:hypothetical protein
LLYLVAVFDLVNEDFRRLEAGDEMLIDDDSSVSRNVARNFFLSLFIDETSESTNIDIMSGRHGVFYNGKEGFYGCGDIGFVYAGFFRDLINNVCFRHGAWVLLAWIGPAKLICAAIIKNNIDNF